MIWRIRPASVRMVSGRGSGILISRVMSLSSALTLNTCATSCATICGLQSMVSTSSTPDSTLERSSTSLISSSRCLPLLEMVFRCFCQFASAFPSPRLRTSVKPRIAVIGVRISWLILERKSLLARLASSAASRALRNSFSFSSSSVTSSRLIRTPLAFLPASMGEQLT